MQNSSNDVKSPRFFKLVDDLIKSEYVDEVIMLITLVKQNQVLNLILNLIMYVKVEIQDVIHKWNKELNYQRMNCGNR